MKFMSGSVNCLKKRGPIQTLPALLRASAAGLVWSLAYWRNIFIHRWVCPERKCWRHTGGLKPPERLTNEPPPIVFDVRFY